MRICTRFGRFVLCALLLLACHETFTPTYANHGPLPRKRALLIGIDDYSARGMRARREWRPVSDRALSPLHGTVRDVGLLKEMLVARYGFAEAGIVTLTNQQATHDAILAAIENHLIAPAAENDILLFYYAGHGSQVENSLSSELDEKDESIIPADSRLGAPDIRDKKLAVLFNRILDKRARLTLIFDSCNSGSVTRALEPDADVRAVRPDPRDVRDPSDPPAPEARGALVMTAAKDFARAYEAEDEQGKKHGVFSWALLRAMRNATSGEAASDTFLRAQAMMRAGPPYQDPVMSGDAAARLLPLLSDESAKAEESAIAVEAIESDGTVILQGGWAHGLTVGSELRVRQAGDDAGVRVRITEMLGLTRCKARMDMTRTRGGTARPALVPGALLDLVSWSAPPPRPIRVWMPQIDDVEKASALARQVREQAEARGVDWVDDPTQTTPTHILRWHDPGWELRSPDGISTRIASSEQARSIVTRIAGDNASLFVHLPAPSTLVRELGVGPGTDYDNVVPLQHPSGADYVLAGRLSKSGVEYAWVRPGVLEEDESDTPLPARTDWEVAEPVRDAAIAMRRTVLRLYKILAWHDLTTPADGASPYKLKLRDPSGVDVDGARVVGGRKYQLVLQAIQGRPPTTQRYYYVFGLDAFGKSVLLFPRRGSVENRFPLDPDAPPVGEISIGHVNVMAPYGQDTYVLLSTDDSLPNPWILEWAGVRTRGPRGQTALEDLLSQVGGSTRGQGPVDTSPIWSVDRLSIQSIPPEGGVP